MGVPTFEPANIPFNVKDSADIYQLLIDEESVDFSVVGVGNPHAVIFVDDVQTAPVQRIGSQLEVHELFPNRTNVQFVQIESRNRIKQRIFERGVGETLASGSGACAAAAVARRLNKIENSVQVDMPGGTLDICFENETGRIFMTGPTEFSFEGNINI